MRYPADHKLATRKRLLAEASKEVRAKGPDRVGVAAVMKRARLTHGGFYAHFASKDALVAAAIGTMFDSAHERWLSETRDRDPAAALAAYIEFYLSAAHRDAVATGCPIAALSSDVRRLPTASRAVFAGGVHALTDAIAAKLDELGHRDGEALAGSVVAELVGALALARVEPDRERSTAMLASSRRVLRARLGL